MPPSNVTILWESTATAQSALFNVMRVSIWLAQIESNVHHRASGVPGFLSAKVQLHKRQSEHCSVQVVSLVLIMSGQQGHWCNFDITEPSLAFLFLKVKKCNPIELSRGFLSCSDPNGPFTFGSLCSATCEKGFLLNGTVSTECSSLGLWSADIPQCLGKESKNVFK